MFESGPVGEHHVELWVPDEARPGAGNAGVAHPFTVLAEGHEGGSRVGPHDELGRNALVYDVDDGTADRAQFLRDRFGFGHHVQLLGPHRERERVARADRPAFGRGNEQAIAGRSFDLEEFVDSSDDRRPR